MKTIVVPKLVSFACNIDNVNRGNKYGAKLTGINQDEKMIMYQLSMMPIDPRKFMAII